MRLAYIDPNPVPDTRPATLQILQTVDALGKIGVTVDLVTPRPRHALSPSQVLKRELPPGVCLHHLPDPRNRWWFPSGSNRPFFFMAANYLSRLQADALLVRNLKLAARLLRRRNHCPLFFETHEIFAQSYRENFATLNQAQERRYRALAATEAFVYQNAAGIITITQCLADDIRERYGAATPSIVAPDGVDLELAREARQPRPANTPPILLYLGSLHPWKGVDTLIRAMRHIDGAVLHIAGGTEQRIAELKALSDAEQVADRVRFLGKVPPAQRFEIINRADICLLPLTNTSIGSRYTSPLKLFEYMAMGKPIITADFPSLREVLTHEETALLTESGNPKSLADSANRLLADAPLRHKLGTAAAEAAETYSWSHRAETIKHFIDISSHEDQQAPKP